MKDLTGSQLEVWLDEIDERHEQSEKQLADEAQSFHLPTLLNEYTYQPDTMSSVWRLHRLWMIAEDKAAGLAVLDQAVSDVLPVLQHLEKQEAQVRMSFWRANAEDDDIEQLSVALHNIEITLNQIAGADDELDLWSNLAQRSFSAKAYELERRCSEKMLSLRQASTHRAAYRAWDSAVCAAQKSGSYHAEGQEQQAKASCDESIKFMSDAEQDQDIDHDDWIKIGNMLVDFSPSCHSQITTHTRAAIEADASLARKREMEVHLRRIEARAMYRLGDMQAAITKGSEGHYGLRHDDDDSFGGMLLSWMLEADQKDNAAYLAFESVFCAREGALNVALHHANAQVQSSEHKNAYWPLCLAFACLDKDLDEYLDSEVENSYSKYIDIAQLWEPSNPAIELLQAEKLFAEKKFAEALPLFENIFNNPALLSLSHGDLGFKYWRCLVKEHGIKTSLKSHTFELACGTWCYGMALDIAELKDHLPKGVNWPKKRAKKVAEQYYLQGLANFEKFFKTGKGYFRDGDIHTYSMLCNNLATDYSAEAIVLHQKGIGASPFSEHYDGILGSHKALENWEEYIKAAEALWHFADKNGYSRHEPEVYVWKVTNVLADELDRPYECAIWLQRLTSWWDSLDDEDRQEHEEIYWANLPIVIGNVGDDQPQDAIDMIEVVLPEILKYNRPAGIRRAAFVYEELEHWEKAIELYQLAISLTGTDDDDFVEGIKDDIKDCQRGLKKASRKGGAWWKVW